MASVSWRVSTSRANVLRTYPFHCSSRLYLSTYSLGQAVRARLHRPRFRISAPSVAH